MIIIADEARAWNDDSVTAESFLICRIRLWHAPSQDGGNLFICAEERGRGGQLASTIRQPSDKQYITTWDSQTNERGRRNVLSGWTEFCNHPATLITCTALDLRILYSRTLWGVTSHIRCIPRHRLLSYEVSFTQRNVCRVKRYPTETVLISCKRFTLIHALLCSYNFTVLILSFKVDQSNLEDIFLSYVTTLF